MIPQGRPVVDAEGAAQLLGMAYKTFRNKGVARQSGFPRPVNPGRRKLLYDLRQVEAFRDGLPELPELPAGTHTDDLLDEQEVARLLGVGYGTVRADRAAGRLPKFVDVCGVAHLPRSVAAGVPAMRPGRGVGGGRPRKPAAG